MECCFLLFVLVSRAWHTSFFVDRSLLNFVFAFQNGRLDDSKSSSGLCDDCSIAALSMSEIAIGMSEPEFGPAFSSKQGYEGNVAFHIGKDSDTGEWHERGFPFLKVFMGCYAGFSVYKREANVPTAMH